jgi:Zn finger protein HypA/HybF involved in hydrogenase expression
MHAEPYLTKSGNKQKRPVVSERELDGLMSEGGQGFCLSCGQTTDGVEPDARKYTCPTCQQPKVYGFEELLIMGLLKVK